MKEVIIVDLDGTLANCEHRVHHVQSSPKDWKSFNAKIGEDSLNAWCKRIIDSVAAQGIETILLTGRSEATREVTENWLDTHGVSFQSLFMRGVDDDRSDSAIKSEIYKSQIEPHYKTLFVIEDRKSVVEMWRDINVTCLQCDWGDF